MSIARSLFRSALVALALGLASCDSPSGPKPAGSPAHVDVISGNAQTAVAGAGLGSPLVVKVTDSKGKPVVGQAVQYQILSGGGSLSANSATTGSDGQAQVTWTLGTVARDTQKVEARVLDSSGGVLASAIFKAVALPDVPAALTKVAGDAQSGAVGATLADSLAVKLADRFGNANSGQTVTFAVASGGGSVSPATRTTDSAGVAKTQWTLGARLDSAQAATASFGSLAPVSFAATATVAGTLAKVAGDGQTGAVGHVLADSLAVRLTTAGGAPVRGATIQWTTTGGSLVPATSTTDANGTAKTSWLLGTQAGAQTATATVVGGSASATFSATATPGPAERVVVVSGDGQRGTFGAPLADSLAVRALDHDGNPVPGVAVTWTVVQGGGSVSPSTYNTGADGIARTRWTLGTGPDSMQDVRAALPTGAGVTMSAVAGLPTGLVVTKVAGDHQSGAGGSVLPDSLVARVATAAGTPLAGVTVEWVPYLDGVAVGGSASPPSSVTDANGLAKTSWRLPTNTTAATMRMKVGGAYVDSAFRATVLASAPATVTVQGNTSLQGPPGSTFPVSVRVLDASGNPVRGVQVHWAVTGGAGAVAPPEDTTDATGVAAAQWTLGPADGTNTLTATVTGLTPATLYATARTSGTLTVRIDYPTTLHAEPDSLFVAATVQSTYILSSVTAEVEGRTVTMFASQTYGWEGILNLAGLPRGPLQVKVTAVDVQNDTAVALRTFVHDNPPHVTLVQPLQYAVARPTLRVVADCTDDDPAGCASIGVYVTGSASALATQNGTHFDGTVSLAAYEGQRVRLEVRGKDSAGNITTVFDSVAVESSASLSPVDAVSGRILDVTADRILFVDRTNRYGDLKVRDRGTGAVQTVHTGAAGDSVMDGRLSPTGVLYVVKNGTSPSSNPVTSLYEWRAGTTTQLRTGFVYNDRTYGSFGDVQVRGGYALFALSDGTLIRRDLVAGANTTVGSSTTGSNDVTETGIVYYSTGTDVYRWQSGTVTPVTTDHAGGYHYISASGDTAAFLKNTDIDLWASGTRELLSPSNDLRYLYPGPGYLVRGPWVAYTHQIMNDVNFSSELWVRMPDGSRTLALPYYATVAALNTNGDLVGSVLTGGFYATRAPYTSRTRISTLGDRFFWTGGTLLVSIGGGLFQATY